MLVPSSNVAALGPSGAERGRDDSLCHQGASVRIQTASWQHVQRLLQAKVFGVPHSRGEFYGIYIWDLYGIEWKILMNMGHSWDMNGTFTSILRGLPNQPRFITRGSVYSMIII